MIQSKTSNEISFTVFNLNSISEQGKSIKGSQLILRQKKIHVRASGDFTTVALCCGPVIKLRISQ